MNLGIFGGSFDPVHHGHLRLATCCQQQAQLDEVWFVPAAYQPLKPDGPQASDEHRCEMIRLAISEKNSFRLSRLELERGGLSFTVDTLSAIFAEQSDRNLFFLLGADSLMDLPNWHRPAEICELATLLVVHRNGEPHPDYDSVQAALDDRVIKYQEIDMPSVDASSREIRRRITTGESIDQFVPPAVAKYIKQHQLYSNDAVDIQKLG